MSDRLRIAILITELNVGGAERCAVNLAVRLDRTRFAVEVFSLAPRPAGEQAALVQRLEQAQIPVHFLGATSTWHALAAVRQLRQHLQHQLPHILQTFLFHANVLGNWAARAVPQTQVVTGVRVADPSRWRLWLEHRASRRAARIVCVSQSVADFCRTRGCLPAKKLSVIPNGLDVTVYPACETADLAASGVPASRRALLFVGRLHRQKGLDWFLSACAPTVLDRLPDHDLLIVGDGPQRPELQQLVRSLHLDDRVHFAGWRADVPQLIAASSVLFLPSRWEGMPNVLLEAMASGRPVLATRTEGVLELLGPLADDQSVDVGDAAAFGSKLVRLVETPAAAIALGQQNRQRVAERFSLDAMVSAYEGLYASLATGD